MRPRCRPHRTVAGPGTDGSWPGHSVGLGIPFAERNRVLGIEDSGAGVCAIRLAGFPAIGMEGGNIRDSGTTPLCQHVCTDFFEVLAIIRAGA